MAHFAQIDSDNKVTQVIVIDNANVTDNMSAYITNTLGLSGTWLQTSFNTRGGVHATGGTPLRKNYAQKGFTYDATRDAFIPPKPFPSWVLNERTCQWSAPVAYPTVALALSGAEHKNYKWDESAGSWVEYVRS